MQTWRRFVRNIFQGHKPSETFKNAPWQHVLDSRDTWMRGWGLPRPKEKKGQKWYSDNTLASDAWPFLGTSRETTAVDVVKLCAEGEVTEDPWWVDRPYAALHASMMSAVGLGCCVTVTMMHVGDYAKSTGGRNCAWANRLYIATLVVSFLSFVTVLCAWRGKQKVWKQGARVFMLWRMRSGEAKKARLTNIQNSGADKEVQSEPAGVQGGSGQKGVDSATVQRSGELGGSLSARSFKAEGKELPQVREIYEDLLGAVPLPVQVAGLIVCSYLLTSLAGADDSVNSNVVVYELGAVLGVIGYSTVSLWAAMRELDWCQDQYDKAMPSLQVVEGVHASSTTQQGSTSSDTPDLNLNASDQGLAEQASTAKANSSQSSLSISRILTCFSSTSDRHVRLLTTKTAH